MTTELGGRVLAAAALIGLLAACGGDNPDAAGDSADDGAQDQNNTDTGDADQDNATDDAEGTGGDQDSEDGDETAGGETSAEVEDVDPDDVAAEEVYEVPDSDDSVTVGLMSLEADDQVMVLRLAITPEFDSLSDSEELSVFEAFGEESIAPEVIDRENLKQYSIITDGPQQDWASDLVGTTVSNGDTVVWWGYYAAPEDDVEALDVTVLDSMPAFTDVTITERS